MRLICPNCAAQYEVDDSVIPSSGRDVQCSSCGHTWFQMPVSQNREDLSESPAHSGTPPPPGEPETPAGDVQETADTPAAGTTPEIAAEIPDDTLYEEIEEEVVIGFISPDSSLPPEQTADDTGLHPDETGNDTPAAARPRPVDESVLNILREEAEAEINMRKREGIALETQADMDLGAPAGGMAPLRKQEDDPRGPETTHDGGDTAEETTGPGTRRDLLPDIEEINSTLQAGTTTDENEKDREREAQISREARIRHRRGVRLGFSLMLALLALALLSYVYADTLTRKFPGSAPAIAAYVDRINGLRFWLDGVVERATILVDGTGSGG